MKPNLKNGKLCPLPQSFFANADRVKQLKHELVSIEAQIDSPAWVARFPVPGDYDNWRGSARRAQGLFQQEKRLREEWASNNLFLGAYELLKKLQLEVEFGPEETAFMAHLHDHFSQRRTDVPQSNESKAGRTE